MWPDLQGAGVAYEEEATLPAHGNDARGLEGGCQQVALRHVALAQPVVVVDLPLCGAGYGGLGDLGLGWSRFAAV